MNKLSKVKIPLRKFVTSPLLQCVEDVMFRCELQDEAIQLHVIVVINSIQSIAVGNNFSMKLDKG